MKFGVRGKLFGVSLVMIIAAGVAASLFIETRIVGWLTERIEGHLLAHAHAARELVQVAPTLHSLEATDAWIDRFGDAIDARVTLIERGGRVLAESSIETAQVPRMGNLADRPEVIAALRDGVGTSTRYSDTVQHEMRYVAVTYKRSDGDGVIRVALTLREMRGLIENLRRMIYWAVLAGLFIAILMSAFASHLLSRTLRRLVQTVQERLGYRVDPTGDPSDRDEVRFLDRAMHRLSEDFERARADLADERARVSAIFDRMQEAIIAVDGELRVLLANTAATTLFNLPKTIRGRKLMALIRVPEIHQFLEESRWAGTEQSVEFALPGKTPRTVLAHLVQQEPGEGVVIVMHDITRLRALESIRSDFVANVSHELRTPVSVIRAGAENLLDGAKDDPAVSVRFLESILKNADRLGRLVADLLDLSRIESGEYGLEPQRVSVPAAVAQVMDTLRLRAAGKSITLHTDVDDTLSVYADSDALEQVLLNLVDNAVKYVPEGGRVVVRAIEEADRIHFEVEDDGHGISAEHQARLFERFYRVDAGRSQQMGGTGLGLAIVKHLIHGMGGRVDMRPASERGAIFYFDLPASAPSGPDQG